MGLKGVLSKLANKQRSEDSLEPSELAQSESKPIVSFNAGGLEESSGDLSEAFSKVVDNLYDDDKIWYATEFMDLEEMRLVATLWTIAKHYHIPILETYIKTYLVAKTSYKRKRTKESIEMVKGAKRDIEVLSGKLSSLMQPKQF